MESENGGPLTGYIFSGSVYGYYIEPFHNQPVFHGRQQGF